MSCTQARGTLCAALVLGLALVLATSAGAGTKRKPVECTEPSQPVTWAPVDLELSVSNQAELSTLAVELNGSDVTDAFTLALPSGGRRKATAEDVWDGAVLPGTNTMHASVVSGGQLHECTRSFEASGDPYADAVVSWVVGANGGYPGVGFLPAVVTGPPSGAGLFQGGLDVFSLGFGGEIVMRFEDNAIVDRDGPDFIVFENAFLAFDASTLTIERPFADPAIVSVSQDGVTWYAFPCQLVTNPSAGIYYPGCAGVFPVLSNESDPSTPHASIPTQIEIGELIGLPLIPPPEPGGAGGDRFDLADVGIAWARYVRVQDANFVTGDPYGPNNAGADVDAVTAIHSVPATDANGNGIPDQVE